MAARLALHGRRLGAGASGAGGQPAAEGAGGREDADPGEGATGRGQHQQSHQQHADGQQQVPKSLRLRLLPLSGPAERLADCRRLSLLRQKKSAEILQAMEEDR